MEHIPETKPREEERRARAVLRGGGRRRRRWRSRDGGLEREEQAAAAGPWYGFVGSACGREGGERRRTEGCTPFKPHSSLDEPRNRGRVE